MTDSTPWKVIMEREGPSVIDANGKLLIDWWGYPGRNKPRAIADKVVLTANNHDALVSALRHAWPHIGDALARAKSEANDCDPEMQQRWAEVIAAIEAEWNAAKAALAAVEGDAK